MKTFIWSKSRRHLPKKEIIVVKYKLYDGTHLIGFSNSERIWELLYDKANYKAVYWLKRIE